VGGLLFNAKIGYKGKSRSGGISKLCCSRVLQARRKKKPGRYTLHVKKKKTKQEEGPRTSTEKLKKVGNFKFGKDRRGVNRKRTIA